MKVFISIAFLAIFVMLINIPSYAKNNENKEIKTMELKVTSTAFDQGGMIP